ncbi:hypothetical protein GQ44DRAFT_776823 [Phaeosphaeriaceae sp. PMI808]|nr:hypothetical protein GQ44DRAFT_776823 [Phaeosphaeriaceae sp. PMI808]
MAEALAGIGCVGAICNLIECISKIISTIADLTHKWLEAELHILSLTSQLTALRAATTKIQEWMCRDLQDIHHQLAMDLDISVKCCRLLIIRVESFFSDLASLAEKPLDFSNRFKVVFGSTGPESIQKLIERQTSALTLLLTACNCNTVSEQQRHLRSNRSRKVLNRAHADSVSLCVQRDTASFASKMTDNLSKISRIFDFDPKIFSTRVYERAFRGSIMQALKQQQLFSPPPTPVRCERIYLLGDDEAGKDVIINALYGTFTGSHPEEMVLYRSQLMQLCVELMCTIVKRVPSDWSTADAQITILLAYSLCVDKDRPRFADALDACAILWWSSLRSLHEPDPKSQALLGESIKLKNMIFYVEKTPAAELHVYCGNNHARFFVDQMERVLPRQAVAPRYSLPSCADYLRSKALWHPSHIFECPFQSGPIQFAVTGTSVTDLRVWPTFQNLQSALVLALIFDLQDYSDRASPAFYEMPARLETNLTNLSVLESRGPPSDLPILLMLHNYEAFKRQIRTTKYCLLDGQYTNDYEFALIDIEERVCSTVTLTSMTLVLYIEEGSAPTELIDAILQIDRQRNEGRVDLRAEKQFRRHSIRRSKELSLPER